ncbi:MAG: hypothetical protein JF606_17830 [Burkholderiales bacterium]|jgi:hypothetical protein|nr:hypothetical protein [Burkholderiales bacterium]
MSAYIEMNTFANGRLAKGLWHSNLFNEVCITEVLCSPVAIRANGLNIARTPNNGRNIKASLQCVLI